MGKRKENGGSLGWLPGTRKICLAGDWTHRISYFKLGFQHFQNTFFSSNPAASSCEKLSSTILNTTQPWLLPISTPQIDSTSFPNQNAKFPQVLVFDLLFNPPKNAEKVSCKQEEEKGLDVLQIQGMILISFLV